MSAEDWNVKNMAREELENELETRRGEYEATSLALKEAGVPEMVDVAEGHQWRALAKRVRELVDQRDRVRRQHDCGNKESGVNCALMCEENADGGGICFRCYREREIADFKDVGRALGDTCDQYLVGFGQVASYIDAMRAQYERQLEVGTPAYVSEIRAEYERALAEMEEERDEARDGVDAFRQVLTSLVNAVEDAIKQTVGIAPMLGPFMKSSLAPAIELVNGRPLFCVWVEETYKWGGSRRHLDRASACTRQEAEEKMARAIADHKESDAIATTFEVKQRWPWADGEERPAVEVVAGEKSEEYVPVTGEVCGARNDLNDRRCVRSPHEKGTMHASEGMSWFDKHVPQEKYGGKSLAQWLRGDRT